MFYALEYHPSYRAIHTLTNLIMHTSSLPAFQFHEVDGAYANERLNAYYLSSPGFDACSGGFFMDHSRCQNHATHLITVAVLNLVGCNALSKLYQLTVFLSNLGYVLRLQTALKEWLMEHMEFDSTHDLSGFQPDPLMAELRSYIDQWHHHNQDQVEDRQMSDARKTQFDRKLEAFADMWDAGAAGCPKHKCNCGLLHDGKHCRDRNDAATKMASTLINLLLTSCPSPPAPNKWTKLWRPVDFVGVGILLNAFLPSIFDIAFKAMGFSTDNPQTDESDVRLVEKLQFHEVQGKRYLGSKSFLQDRESQFAMRLLMVALESLRYLTDVWLGNLKALKNSRRQPLFVLFDPQHSPVTAALQNISSLLMSSSGKGRLAFLWATSFDSYESWCSIRPDELRFARRVLMSVSAYVHRRHVCYWDQFPWL